jgi:hypothetical protein
VIEQIRTYWHAEPFQPFQIHMSDGRVFKMLSPDTVLVTPNNAIVVWLADHDAFVRLNALHITSVTGIHAPA